MVSTQKNERPQKGKVDIRFLELSIFEQLLLTHS
jgi:hypothetical protein